MPLFVLSSMSHPEMESVALVNDGAKSNIIESPPCFPSSFVQVESWREAESMPDTRLSSLSMFPRSRIFLWRGIFESSFHSTLK